MNGVALGTGMQAIHKPNTMSSYHSWISYHHCQMSSLPATETNFELQIQYRESERSTGHLVANWLHGPLKPWKGKWFILTKINTHSRNGFAFPSFRALAKSLFKGFQSIWSTSIGSHIVCQTKRSTLWQRSSKSMTLGTTDHITYCTI